jgi:hypothetical protein
MSTEGWKKNFKKRKGVPHKTEGKQGLNIKKREYKALRKKGV